MKLFALLALLFATPAFAAVHPYFEDIKLPTQQMVEKQSWAAPITASSVYILSAQAGPTSAAAQTITTFAHQPDVARNLTLIPGGALPNLASCVVTVAGTDYNGNAISEDFTMSAGSGATITGNKAFKTVTSFVAAASCVSSPFLVNWNLGVSTKLGFKRCMADAGSYFHGAADGVKEATSATIASSVSSLANNTLIFNTAPNSSRNFDAYFMQNFRCTR